MGSALRSDFKDNKLALIRGAWANKVAKVCSHWIGQDGIEVVIPENPTGNNPCRVMPNMNVLAKNIFNRMQYEGMIELPSSEVGTAEIGADESYFDDDQDVPEGYEMLANTSKWDKGDKDSDDNEIGVEFSVITRCENDGDFHYLYSRQLTFSKSGLLVKVGPEETITQIGA